jgi:hypothetical protein
MRLAPANGDTSSTPPRACDPAGAHTATTIARQNRKKLFTSCFSFGGAVSYSQFTTRGKEMDRQRLEAIEKYILSFFQAEGHTRILASELFGSTGAYANADMVRALEALEKTHRLLVRHTTDGNDYISLTPQGVAELGFEEVDPEESALLPHPPKSATRNI